MSLLDELEGMPEPTGFEDFALRNLSERIPGLYRKSLKKCLNSIKPPMGISAEGNIQDYPINILPDACRFEPRTEEIGGIIQLFEVEDTNKISKQKLKKIENFGIDVYDLWDLWVDLYVVDRYGISATLIWTSRDYFSHQLDPKDNPRPGTSLITPNPPTD